MTASRDLVHVRTTTYRRPGPLRRAIESLQMQSSEAWICDVYDDDPEGSGAAVCDALGDPRTHYHHNRPQRFASANIDRCFSRDNPHDAASIAQPGWGEPRARSVGHPPP